MKLVSKVTIYPHAQFFRSETHNRSIMAICPNIGALPRFAGLCNQEQAGLSWGSVQTETVRLQLQAKWTIYTNKVLRHYWKQNLTSLDRFVPSSVKSVWNSEKFIKIMLLKKLGSKICSGKKSTFCLKKKVVLKESRLLFLAAMNSSRSDNVTQSVRLFIPFLLPWCI